jgi:hypothetical protein
MFNYQEKYLKYKNKYLKLKDLIGGERKFKCDERNRNRIIGNLCVLDEKGTYDDKINCEINCLEIKLNEELSAWIQLFAWCSETFRDVHIYCKGGSALGLLVLKTILDKNRSKYDDFVNLNLIKDWDFTVIMSDYQQAEFIKKAKELDIHNQGETLAILRHRKGLLLGEDYLLELSIKTSQELYDLELPLTNLKFEVNSENINLFFEIVKMYVKKVVNLDILSSNLDILLRTIVVNGEEQVDSIQNGLYTIDDPNYLSTANLNHQLLEIMYNVSHDPNDIINQLTFTQFLITQFCQPDRLFIRFLDKNVIKSRKITKFYIDNRIDLPEWLINENILDEILRKIINFLSNLNQFIKSQISIEGSLDSPKLLLRPFITSMNTLFENVNLSRIEFTPSNKELLKYLVPWEFFQIIKQKEIINQKATIEEYIVSEKGRLLTPEQIEAKRTKIFIKLANFIPAGDSKYTQFLSTNIDKLE